MNKKRKKHILITHYYPTLKRCRLLKLPGKEGRNIHIAHSQYQDNWWPADVRRQYIGSHGIDLSCRECDSLSKVKWNSD